MKTKPRKPKGISNTTLLKHKAVIDEWFINGFNGVEAYIKIYPKSRVNTAAPSFEKLKKSKEISDYIKYKHQQAAKKIQITHDGILSELKNWIESDITETINLSAEEIKVLPVEIRRLITKYKHVKTKRLNKEGEPVAEIETIELHFVSKEKAIEMINRHIGFYETDNQQKAEKLEITVSNQKQKDLIDSILNGD